MVRSASTPGPPLCCAARYIISSVSVVDPRDVQAAGCPGTLMTAVVRRTHAVTDIVRQVENPLRVESAGAYVHRGAANPASISPVVEVASALYGQA